MTKEEFVSKQAKMKKQIEMHRKAADLLEKERIELRKKYALEFEEHYNVGQVIHINPKYRGSNAIERPILNVFVDDNGFISYRVRNTMVTGQVNEFPILDSWLKSEMEKGYVLDVITPL